MEPRPPDGHTSDARAILKNCRMDLDAVRREAGWQADTACPPPTAEAVLGSVVDRLDRLTALIEGTFAGPGQLSLTQAEMVAREADHRIRNNLQLVASLLQRQAREASDGAANALRLAAAQVGAVAALHSFLHDGARQIAHDGGRIDLSGYLEGLAQSFADTFELGDAQRSLHVELETVMVTPDTARSIGLIVSELVANALRHAFTPAEPGTIRITGKLRRADGAYQLAIQDDGAGLPQGFDLRLRQTGFGLRLVSLLADQLRARLTVHGKPGARFLLTLPPVQ